MLQTTLQAITLLIVLLLYVKVCALQSKVFEPKSQFGLALDDDGTAVDWNDYDRLRKFLLDWAGKEDLPGAQLDSIAKYLGLDARDMENALYQVSLLRADPTKKYEDVKWNTLTFRALCSFDFDALTDRDRALAKALVIEAHGNKKNFIWF